MRSTALADVVGTWLHTLAAARAALSNPLVRGPALPHQPSTSSASPCPCAPPLHPVRPQAALTGGRLHLGACPLRAALHLQKLAGWNIGELVCEEHKLRSPAIAQQEPAAAESSLHHTQPLRECPRRPAPTSQA